MMRAIRAIKAAAFVALVSVGVSDVNAQQQQGQATNQELQSSSSVNQQEAAVVAAAITTLNYVLKSLQYDNPLELSFSGSTEAASAREIQCESECCDAVIAAVEAAGCGCACGAGGGTVCTCY